MSLNSEKMSPELKELSSNSKCKSLAHENGPGELTTDWTGWMLRFRFILQVFPAGVKRKDGKLQQSKAGSCLARNTEIRCLSALTDVLNGQKL